MYYRKRSRSAEGWYPRRSFVLKYRVARSDGFSGDSENFLNPEKPLLCATYSLGGGKRCFQYGKQSGQRACQQRARFAIRRYWSRRRMQASEKPWQAVLGRTIAWSWRPTANTACSTLSKPTPGGFMFYCWISS